MFGLIYYLINCDVRLSCTWRFAKWTFSSLLYFVTFISRYDRRIFFSYFITRRLTFSCMKKNNSVGNRFEI